MRAIEHRLNLRELPVLLTPDQLAKDVFQIDHDEKHIAHLRRHGGLPYVQFQLGGRRIFRYPRAAVMEWIAARTHGAKAHAPTAGKTQQVDHRPAWSGRR